MHENTSCFLIFLFLKNLIRGRCPPRPMTPPLFLYVYWSWQRAKQEWSAGQCVAHRPLFNWFNALSWLSQTYTTYLMIEHHNYLSINEAWYKHFSLWYPKMSSPITNMVCAYTPVNYFSCRQYTHCSNWLITNIFLCSAFCTLCSSTRSYR